MGNAEVKVTNDLDSTIEVSSYNYADTVYWSAHETKSIAPGSYEQLHSAGKEIVQLKGLYKGRSYGPYSAENGNSYKVSVIFGIPLPPSTKAAIPLSSLQTIDRGRGETSSATVFRATNLPSYNKGQIYATELLKDSGQAKVFKGVDKANANTPIALKVFPSLDLTAFRNEVAALQQAGSHPNVIKILGYFDNCIVMPLIRGGDLRDYLNSKGAMQAVDAVKVIKGIAKGLKHLHSHNIVHRDLKSPNVLLQLPSLEPVLIDLGMGRQVDSSFAHLTLELKGTYLWMAPEMMSGNTFSKKTDIYALGIIMWEIFSGKVPFSEYHYKDGNVLMYNVINSNWRPGVELARGVGVRSGHLQLMGKCWEKDADLRPSATDFLHELDSC